MKQMTMTAFAAVLTLAVACHKDDRAANDALQNDLNLASQANSARSLDSISPVEGGYGAGGAPSRAATRPTGARSTTGSTRRSRSSTASGANTGGAVGGGAATTTTVQKNTKRDAAIGAAAGAIIGATTSRNKVKGGVIGAAAGGILGGIIGNNVDVKKKKSP
jgi:hypothetical protein